MASDLCFLELFFPLPASRITHKSIKYSILKSTDTAPPPLHPLSPLPKVVCEILRLIEEKECDPVAPSCREGCYKCVCVCLIVGSKWLYVHLQLACDSQKCLLSFFSPIQFSSNGFNTDACTRSLLSLFHTLTHMHIHKHKYTTGFSCRCD